MKTVKLFETILIVILVTEIKKSLKPTWLKVVVLRHRSYKILTVIII